MDQVNDSINQIKKFIELLETRTKITTAITQDMIQLLGPTVIEALHEVMQVADENVTWVDVNVIEHMVVLDAVVSMKIDDLSPFMLSITPPENLQLAEDDSDVLEQVVKIGIPADLCFTTKQKIVDFINDTSTVTRKVYHGGSMEDNIAAATASTASESKDFDLSQLTAEQRASFMYPDSKKVVH